MITLQIKIGTFPSPRRFLHALCKLRPTSQVSPCDFCHHRLALSVVQIWVTFVWLLSVNILILLNISVFQTLLSHWIIFRWMNIPAYLFCWLTNITWRKTNYHKERSVWLRQAGTRNLRRQKAEQWFPLGLCSHQEGQAGSCWGAVTPVVLVKRSQCKSDWGSLQLWLVHLPGRSIILHLKVYPPKSLSSLQRSMVEALISTGPSGSLLAPSSGSLAAVPAV